MFGEAHLLHETIDKMIRRSLDLAAAFSPLAALAIENNDSLGMVVSEFEQQIRELQRFVPLKGVLQTVNKEVRIRRLGLYFSRSKIRFRNTRGTRMMVDQLRDFPQAEHDDGPSFCR